MILDSGSLLPYYASKLADSKYFLFLYSLLQLRRQDFQPSPFVAHHVDHGESLEPAKFAFGVVRQLLKNFHGFFIGAVGLGGIMARHVS